jgi:anti-anti-sigma factor
VSEVQVFQPTRILSSSTTGDLLDGITRSLEAGNRTILINLKNVLFMDSSGLAALVIVLKRIKVVDGRFALCEVNGQARMLLEQTEMTQVFEIYETADDFYRTIAQSKG